jgi:hypothetical protein
LRRRPAAQPEVAPSVPGIALPLLRELERLDLDPL